MLFQRVTMQPKQLGFGFWLWVIGPHAKAPKNFKDTLAIAKQVGYTAISAGGFGEHITPVIYDTASKRNELRAELVESGMALDYMAPDVWGPQCRYLGSHGPQGYIDNLRPYAQLAAAVGIPGLRIDPLYSPQEVESDPKTAKRTLIEVVQGCADLCAEFGLGLTVEAEPAFHVVSKVAGAAELIERVDRPNCGLLADWCHLNAIAVREGITVLEAIDRLAHVINTQHVADNKDGELVHEAGFDHPPTGRHLPLGSGNIPLQAVAARMEQIPKLAASSIRTHDLCFYVGEYPAVLQQSLDVMRQLYGVAA